MSAQLRVETRARSGDLGARNFRRYSAEVWMRQSVRADIVAPRAQPSDLIPGHPLRLDILFAVPPGNVVGFNPVGRDEEARSLIVFFQNRRSNRRISDISVIERNCE